ncbi:MAG: RNA-guided endonuclease TnpB family protein, partial [Sarcina sp.]
KTYTFSGKRIKRGLYKTANDKTINADINGALNILKKSSVVDLSVLYSSGEVATPVRIRID